MDLEAVIEIPKGSRNKYETDPETGKIWLDRMLFTATRYPTDYGYVPETLAADGDPLDILVLVEEPTFPGCHIHVRAIGVFWMKDEAGEDAKVISVPTYDERWGAVRDLSEVPPYLIQEIEHFFHIYKQLEPGKKTEPGKWEGKEGAARAVEESRRRLEESR